MSHHHHQHHLAINRHCHHRYHCHHRHCHWYHHKSSQHNCFFFFFAGSNLTPQYRHTCVYTLHLARALASSTHHPVMHVGVALWDCPLPWMCGLGTHVELLGWACKLAAIDTQKRYVSGGWGVMGREQAHIQEKQSTQTHTQTHTFNSHIQLTFLLLLLYSLPFPCCARFLSPLLPQVRQEAWPMWAASVAWVLLLFGLAGTQDSVLFDG